MRIWTIQPLEVLDIINETGRFICDKSKSTYGDDEQFQKAYKWMIGTMIHDRNITKPDDVELPIWGWYVWNWKHKKPDFRMIGLGRPGIKYVCIELELDEDKVLLSDFDAWHNVLNDRFNNPATTEKDYERREKRFDNLRPNLQYLTKIMSWDNIFNILPFKNNFCSNGQYVQATFWEIRKENIISVKEFIAR